MLQCTSFQQQLLAHAWPRLSLDAAQDVLHLLPGSSWHGEGTSYQQPPKEGISLTPSHLSPYFWSFRDDPNFFPAPQGRLWVGPQVSG